MSFTDNWKAAAENDGKLPEPEPGTYTATVSSAEGFYSKNGTECVRVTLDITDSEDRPDLVGRSFDHMMFFGNEVGARISRENLALYGVEVSKVNDFDELIDRIDEIEGVEADVRVSINGSYVNTNVLRSRTGESDVPSANGDFTPTAPAADDDPPPF